eukprot:SAG11_NODE_23195_length_393_cov_1.214286_1_plen_71_part_10
MQIWPARVDTSESHCLIVASCAPFPFALHVELSHAYKIVWKLSGIVFLVAGTAICALTLKLCGHLILTRSA